MTPAAGYRQLPRHHLADGDGLPVSLQDLERAATLRADIGQLFDRHRHHAQYRLMLVDQGDIDGEFTGAIDEFLGAIQRVHQPVTGPAQPGGRVGHDRFFRQDRNVRRQRRQPRHDDPVRCMVGCGDRRIVILGDDLDRIGRVINLENGCSSLLGNGQYLFQ